MSALFAASVILFSCNLGTGAIISEARVDFDYALSALISRHLSPAWNADRIAVAEASVFSGVMTAEDLDTGEILHFDWYATVDQALFLMESLKTVILSPGTYRFSLDISSDTYRYVGETGATVIDEQECTIDIILRPVIGDVENRFEVVETSAIRLRYDPDEFAAFDAFALGVSVDDGVETILEMNPVTGMSDVYLDVSQGSHQLKLRVYSNGVQIGRSVESQESVFVVPGYDIIIDLVPLYTQSEYWLLGAGNDAMFRFLIPPEVIDEAAAGPESVRSVFSVTGIQNGTTELELELDLAPTLSGDYQAELTIEDYTYDTVDMSLLFYDTSSGEVEIARALVSGVLIAGEAQTVLWNLEICRRSVISGSLLGVVGINVFDESGTPIPGVSIFSDGDYHGITGSGVFGTPGYLKVELPPGAYTLEARGLGYFGNIDVVVPSLGIVNVDIVATHEIIEWEVILDNNHYDHAASIDLAAGGGYIVVGSTRSRTMHSQDALIMRIDDYGELVWSRSWGGYGTDAGYSVERSESDLYVIGGLTTKSSYNSTDLLLLIIDGYGNEVFHRAYGGFHGEMDGNALPLIDGYVISGATYDRGSWRDTDLDIVRFDLNGNRIWERTLGDSYGNEIGIQFGIRPTDDGGLIVVGSSESYNGRMDVHLVKLDTYGNEEWSREFGGPHNDHGAGVAVADDGGYYITGYTESYGAGRKDLFILKADVLGNYEWAHTSGGSDDDAGNALAPTADGGVVVAGYTESFANGKADMYLVKYDASGFLEWTETFGGNGLEVAAGVRQTVDGGYILAGSTGSKGYGTRDVYIVKTGPQH